MEKQELSSHRSKANAKPLNPTLLSIKNKLKFGRRWSSNPQKQLCFTWLSRVLAESAKYDTTLDVACGNLNNYPFVRSPNYIGVDMNKASLDYGRRAYPKARTEPLYIEELEASGLKGDLVLCTQTIGVNNYFDADKTVPNIRSLVKATNEGGTLAFDIGDMSIAKRGEITALLNAAFTTVEERGFGAHDKSSNMLFSIPLGLMMQWFPATRTNGQETRVFYVCRDRKS